MVSEWATVRKPFGQGLPHMLVGYIRVSASGDYIWLALKESAENHDGLRPLRTTHEAFRKAHDVHGLSAYAYQKASWLVPATK
jgi:hypothetical protein